MSEAEILQTVRDTSREALPSLIGVLARAQAEANARLLTPASVPAANPTCPDELISCDEAAQRLGVSKSSLYHRNIPGVTVRRPGIRKLLFSARGIERLIEQQTHK
jgi:hypothetical protein